MLEASFGQVRLQWAKPVLVSSSMVRTKAPLCLHDGASLPDRAGGQLRSLLARVLRVVRTYFFADHELSRQHVAHGIPSYAAWHAHAASLAELGVRAAQVAELERAVRGMSKMIVDAEVVLQLLERGPGRGDRDKAPMVRDGPRPSIKPKDQE